MDPVREATPAERDGWDALAVDAPGGHVYQSVAWARTAPVSASMLWTTSLRVAVSHSATWGF